MCYSVVWLIRCCGFNLWSSMSCVDCQKVKYVQRLLVLFCIQCTCELFWNNCVFLMHPIYTCSLHISAHNCFFYHFKCSSGRRWIPASREEWLMPLLRFWLPPTVLVIQLNSINWHFLTFILHILDPKKRFWKILKPICSTLNECSLLRYVRVERKHLQSNKVVKWAIFMQSLIYLNVRNQNISSTLANIWKKIIALEWRKRNTFTRS